MLLQYLSKKLYSVTPRVLHIPTGTYIPLELKKTSLSLSHLTCLRLALSKMREALSALHWELHLVAQCNMLLLGILLLLLVVATA